MISGVNGSVGELDALDRGIAALEQQREALGDPVVDTALRPLLERRRRLTAHAGERRKLVTVLFSDLVGSTPLTAALGDETMREVMGRYFALWREAIEGQGGHVQKFIGDAVVGVFGMDQAREDDPHRAVRAAVTVRPALGRLSEEVLAAHGQALATRVGIDTGEAVLGRFDERGDGDLVVVGATVNRAARLQTAAPRDGILLSAATARHVRGSFGLQDHGVLELRGVDQPVRTFVVHSVAGSGFWSTARGLEGVVTRTVGREVELQQLTKLFEDTVEDRTSAVVTVVGDAGIGKSRLLADLEAWLAGRSEPVWLLRGRADPAVDALPQGPLRSAFAERFGIQDTDRPAEVMAKWRAGMAGLAGTAAGESGGAQDLMAWLGFTMAQDGEADAADPAALQRRAWVALDDTFAAMGEVAAVVLLLEDLHWADSPVLDLLLDLQARPRPYPLLVVATSRPVLLEQHPHWGEGLPGHREIRLQPLSRRETGLLVAEVLQRADAVPEWVRAQVVDAAEGNPFFVEEVIAWLVDTGTIRPGTDRWTVDAQPAATGTVPGTLRALLEARLDVLPTGERHLVDRASVIGRVFWDTAVDHLDPGPASPPADAYNALRRREVVHRRPSSAFAQAQEFAFRHALLRDVAYDGLLTPDRRRYHARAADWLRESALASGRQDEHAGTVAHHLLAAGQAEDAAPWLLRAARHAARTFANEEALDLLTRAAAGTRDHEVLFDILLERERVLDRTGAREEQHQVLDRLDGAAGDDPSRRARVLLARGRWHFFHAEYDVGADLAQQAIQRAQVAGLVEEHLEAQLLLGRCLAFAGEHLAARKHLEATLTETGGDRSHPRQVAEALRLLGVVATNLHEEQRAIELLQRAAAAYGEAGDEEGQGMVEGQLGAVLMLGGRMEEARVHSEAALATFTASGHVLRQGIVLGNLTSIALETGRLDEGLLKGHRTLELTRSVDDFEGVASSLGRLGEAERMAGLLGPARGHLEAAVQMGEEHGLHYFVFHALRSLSSLALDEGDPVRAVELARSAQEAATRSEVPVSLAHAAGTWGLAALEVGDDRTAVEQLTAARDRMRGLGLRIETVETDAILAEALLLAGRPEDAGARLGRIIAGMGPRGLPPAGEPHPGRGLVACHRVLSALGDRRSSDVTAVAARCLQRRAERITDVGVREGFLATSACRALAAVAAGQATAAR